MGADEAILVEATDNLIHFPLQKLLRVLLRNLVKLLTLFLLVNKRLMMTVFKFHNLSRDDESSFCCGYRRFRAKQVIAITVKREIEGGALRSL
jgi:hypothetical protein